MAEAESIKLCRLSAEDAKGTRAIGPRTPSPVPGLSTDLYQVVEVQKPMFYTLFVRTILLSSRGIRGGERQ